MCISVGGAGMGGREVGPGHSSALEGWRNNSNGPWQVNIDKHKAPQLGNSILKTTTIGEQIQFLHAAAGSHVPSTWIDAINKGYYITLSGLTADNVRKHLSNQWQQVKATWNKSERILHQQEVKEQTTWKRTIQWWNQCKKKII
eukprot:5784507-Ditylum_brightwellii.AAC.1